MIDFEILAAILFLIVITFLISKKSKNLETKEFLSNLFFSMYRTKWGLKLMDSAADNHNLFRIGVSLILILVGIFFNRIFPKGSADLIIYLLIILRIAIFIAGLLILVMPFLFSRVMITFGFIGMILISYLLISGVFQLFIKPESAPAVGIVLPIPVQVPGIFGVPFSYWIISIFIIAFVHEFSHGSVARVYNLKIKSSGFAFVGANIKITGFLLAVFSVMSKLKISRYNFGVFFSSFNFFSFSSPDFWLLVGVLLILLSLVRNFLVPVIPAAFVEPDEKELRKRPFREQLSVFSAGPLSNIVAGFAFILISLFIFTLLNGIFEPNGVKIVNHIKGNDIFPAESSGIKVGEIIQQIDDKPVLDIDNLTKILRNKKPNDIIKVKTDKSLYNVKLAKNPENESSAFLGASLKQSAKLKYDMKENYADLLSKSLVWIFGLFNMLIILNFGIGLFNLLPAGPLDGGRMCQLVLHRIFGKDKGNRILYNAGMVFLFILFIYLFVIFKNIVLFVLK
ncbi:MAG: site-2 protease family protein [Nanoarchaeota archaeon]